MQTWPGPPTAAERVRTPFLILHGSQDTVVRPEQSEALKTILDRNRASNERHVFPGEGHNIPGTRKDEVVDAVVGWFARHRLAGSDRDP